jgi:hypothetical protein
MTGRIPLAFEELLRAKGLSLNAASQLAGSEDLLRDLYRRRKARTLRTDSLARLAAGLEVPMDELARIMALADAPPPLLPKLGPEATLPVRHKVRAGSWLEEDDTGQEPVTGPAVAPDPRYPVDQWLEEVEGDSVDELAPEGSFVQVAAWEGLALTPATGQIVVVQRTRDQGALRERSIKVVRRQGRRIELWPKSTNPRWNQPLVLVDDPTRAEETTVSLAGLVIWVHRPFTGRTT